VHPGVPVPSTKRAAARPSETGVAFHPTYLTLLIYLPRQIEVFAASGREMVDIAPALGWVEIATEKASSRVGRMMDGTDVRLVVTRS
jgi:hypothetical protein